MISSSDDETLRIAALELNRGENLERVARLLDPLVERGNAEAIYLRTCFGSESESTEEFESRRINMLSRAAEMNHPGALYELHIAYEYGDGVQKDLKEAFSLLQRAAELSHKDAHWEMGEMHIYGVSPVELNIPKGLELIECAAALRSTSAYETLARFHEEGSFGYQQNPVESARLRKLADSEYEPIPTP